MEQPGHASCWPPVSKNPTEKHLEVDGVHVQCPLSWTGSVGPLWSLQSTCIEREAHITRRHVRVRARSMREIVQRTERGQECRQVLHSKVQSEQLQEHWSPTGRRSSAEASTSCCRWAGVPHEAGRGGRNPRQGCHKALRPQPAALRRARQCRAPSLIYKTRPYGVQYATRPYLRKV